MKLNEELLELDRKTELGIQTLRELGSERKDIKKETVGRQIGIGWSDSDSIDQYAQLIAETYVRTAEVASQPKTEEYTAEEPKNPLVDEQTEAPAEKYSRWVETSLEDVSTFLDRYSGSIDNEIKWKVRKRFKEQIEDSNIKYRGLKRPSKLAEEFQREAT